MPRNIAAILLSAWAMILAGAVSYPQIARATHFNPWWYSDSALATFLQTRHPGVTIIAPGRVVDPLSPAVKSGGYALMFGLGGGSAQQVLNGTAGGLANIEQAITKAAGEGATYIYVDEPWPAPGQSTAKSAASIAYNVSGFNVIYKWMHKTYPTMKFGLTIGDDGGAALHLSMLKAGLLEDFASAEYYNSCCTNTNPFTALKAAYPNVQTMILAYHTETLCQTNSSGTAPWIPANGVDIWAFWDVDNDGHWIGPEFDGNWLQNVETFASTGSVQSFCVLPYAFDVNYTYTTQKTNFTHNIWDRFYWAQTTPYKIDTTKCQYEVMSGANAIAGPSDPSVKVTLPWKSRPCNGNVTITVGANGNCNVIGSFTCLVLVRNYTTSGLVGNMTYNAYSVSY